MVRARSAAVRTSVGRAATRSTPPKGVSRRPSMERSARRCQRSSPRRADEGRTQSRKRRADERTRTADLASLRVCGQGLLGVAGDCKFRISRRFSLLWFAVHFTVLRSRWCQSGVNIILIFARHPRPPAASQIQSMSLPTGWAKSRLGHRPEGFAIRPSREYGV